MYTKIVAHPGQRDALAALLVEAAALQSVAGCSLSSVNLAATEPEAVRVTEVGSSPETHSAYRETEEMKAALSRGRPLVRGPVEHIELLPQDGKGLPQ